ncbi:MFS general substrate transporter, partial [Linderina pennispora]
IASIGMLFFISALDATIMASIYVPIASDFDALGQAVWIITTYMLSSTIVQAIIGKISDILGRVETILTSIAIFLVGSVLCGASQSMNMLIASRTIQGVGGGGILGLGMVVLGDLFSERERGNYIGVFSAIFTIATVVGPVMGGGIVEHASWRIVFWINIPVCVIAMALIFFTLKLPKTKGTFKEKIKRIDFIGCVLFTIGMVPILLGLSWGGQQYEWTSAQVLACLICGFVVLLVFGYVEYRFVTDPIIPVRLLGNRNVLSALMAVFAIGGVSFGALNNIPAWELAIKHASTTSGGLHLLPMALGVVLASPLCGIYIARSGRFLIPIRVGAVLAAAGASLLLLYKASTGFGERIVYLFLLGLGVGFVSQPPLLVCQASVAGKHMATVTTSYSFIRTLGGILATSIMTSILDSRIKTGITGLVNE